MDSAANASPLNVGAQYACFRCRTRTHALLACPTCNFLPVDLATHEGERKLLGLARHYRRPRTPVPGADRTVRAYRVAVHLIAFGAAFAAGSYGSKIKTNGFVPIKAVTALTGGLGLIAGYVVCAFVGALLFTVFVPLIKLLLPRRRRSVAVAAPVNVGLAAAARIDTIDDAAFEGTIGASSGVVALASDVSGAIVGARGRTIGAGIADALVAPLVIEGTAGEPITVHVDVGEVVFDGDAAREVRFGDGAPRVWGIPRPPPGTRSRRRFPPSESLSVFVAQPGARVRVEGGASGVEAVFDADGVESDRTVVRGTTDAPVRITVLPPVD